MFFPPLPVDTSFSSFHAGYFFIFLNRFGGKFAHLFFFAFCPDPTPFWAVLPPFFVTPMKCSVFRLFFLFAPLAATTFPSFF